VLVGFEHSLGLGELLFGLLQVFRKGVEIERQIAQAVGPVLVVADVERDSPTVTVTIASSLMPRSGGGGGGSQGTIWQPPKRGRRYNDLEPGIQNGNPGLDIQSGCAGKTRWRKQA
jgi:hypothetical protein